MHSHYFTNILAAIPLQARAVDCAKQFKGVSEIKHVEAIAQGLAFAREPLRYCIEKLWKNGDEPLHADLHQVVHKQATCGLLFLMSVLDALVVLDTATADALTANISFFNTPLSDPLQCTIQEDIKSLESFQNPANKISANLSTVNNFFKHYLPLCWPPKTFCVTTAAGAQTVVQDLFVAFGEESGPILYDLVIPAYNKTCDLVLLAARARNVRVAVNKIDM
jgi:hypothetical protein